MLQGVDAPFIEDYTKNNNTARAYVREEITQPHVGKDHFEKIIEEEKDMQYTDAQIEDEKLTKQAIRFMYDWPDYETNKPVTAKVKASLKIAKTKKDFADLMEYASDYRREFLGNGGNPEFMLRPNTWLDKEAWKKYSASYEALIAKKASEPSWKDSAPKPLSYQELAEQEKKRKTTAELDIRGRIVESVTREECNKYFKYNNMWVDLTKDIITLTFSGKNLMREAEEKFSGKIKGLFPNKTIKFTFQGIASQKDENLPSPKDFVGFDREKVKRELEEMRKIREKRVA